MIMHIIMYREYIYARGRRLLDTICNTVQQLEDSLPNKFLFINIVLFISRGEDNIVPPPPLHFVQ